MYPRWEPAVVSQPEHAIEGNAQSQNFRPQRFSVAE